VLQQADFFANFVLAHLVLMAVSIMKTQRYSSLRCASSLALLLGWPAAAHAQMALLPRWTEESPSRENPLPLEQETLTVTIEEQHATTLLSQQYFNRGSQVLEGVCSLQAGQNSKVQGFAYWNGEKKIVGEVFEKEAAAQLYAETTGLKRDPGLIEQTGEGSFSFRVFPIQPKEHKRIELTLAQRLPREGSHVEYRIALANPQARINVSVLDSRRLAHFVSLTHRLELQQSSGRTVVTATPLTNQEREFVLGYDVEERPYTLSVAKHQDPGQPAYLAISLATEPVSQRSAKDVTIVLDHSGSMQGAPMTEARAAAKEIVSRLTDQDRLNVIAFDDQIQSLYTQMEPVTNQSRTAALRFLDSVNEGGGTDIGRALEEALKHQRPSAERPIVLLLTDGESDARQVFDAAERDHSSVRVFTVGLGPGVNRPLLSRLADMKRGKFTYIQSAEAIRSSIARLFGLVETAALKAPELSLENGQLQQMQPSTLPDLAPGEELMVTARATGAGPARLVIKGTTSHGPIRSEAQIQLGATESHPWVGRLWAEERTNRVLEDISLKGETAERRNEAIELAIAYGFVTPYTSFLAIPESELTASTSRAMGDMRARKKAILAKRADAVALSRSEMPPGDPVLTVDAPRDALRVTALFPFGLEKDLTYDPEQKHWRVRFLVPKEVADGKYSVPVMVITRDGQVEFLSGSYVIDSSEPEFEPTVQCRHGTMDLSILTQQPMREVWAAVVADPTRRVRLGLDPKDPSHTRYIAKLKLPGHDARVRIVVTDQARNEASEVVSCEESQP
jgi:Ca-activated chloride channel homolog